MGNTAGRGARERIVAAAAELFDRQGITATTMEQIAATAPVSKRTLYVYFPAKGDLVVTYLQYVYESGTTVESALYNSEVPARERILAMFTVPAPADRPVRGCPFTAAATEFPDPDSPAHAYTRERKHAFTLRIADLLEEMGADDPAGLAEQLAILTDGVASRAMVFNDTGRAAVGRAAAEALLAAAGV
ncbi:TetR family transcriptional regulator [Mycobacterium sp. AMU20-3851]|uniref:TetR family transcriptional regulator n=1 Tax=Mycobacterium sp. AMU20-3851 TaxID=3122055 RepID=UPI003753EEC5